MATMIPGAKLNRIAVMPYFCISILLACLGLLSCSQETKQSEAPAVNSQEKLLVLPAMPDLENYPKVLRQRLQDGYAALESRSASAEALAQASKLFHAHHLEIIALPGYQRAVRAAPQDARWHYLKGVAAKAVGQDVLAQASFAKARELAPGHAPTGIEWAEFELQKGHFDVAGDVYQKILASDPNHVMALWGLGQVALANGQHKQATTHFQRVLDLDPAATMVHYPLSQALAALGKAEAAKANLAKRGDGRPSMPDALMEEVLAMEFTVQGFRRRGDQALRSGRYQAALGHYQQALDLDLNNASTYLNRGWAYFYLQDGAAAAQDWQKVLTLTQKPLLQAQAHFNLAQLARASAQAQAAIDGYRQALALHPDFLAAKLALAEVLRVNGQFSEALTFYEALVLQNPGDAVVRLGRSLCLIRTGAYAKAIAALREDVAAQPQQATFYHMLIRLLAASPGEGIRAGQEAQTMMARLTQNWQVLDSGLAETSAMVFAELGRFQEAIRMQQRALALAKQEGESQHLQARLLTNLQNYADQQPSRIPWPDDAPLFVRPSLQPEPLLQGDDTQN